MEEPIKIQLFLDKREQGVRQPDGTFKSQSFNDFFIRVPFYKTQKLLDYIQVYDDPFKTSINRQLINPFFIELDFFKTIKNIENQDNTGISGKTQIFNIQINS